MTDKIPIILAKTIVFIASDYLIEETGKKKFSDKDLPRIGIFLLGTLIETYYLDKKNIFGIIKDKQLNKHLENYIFSILLQTFGNSLIFDDYKIIIDDFYNISITYALTAPFQQ